MKTILLFILALLLPATTLLAQSDLPKDKSKLQLYLLIGQSNMAGRGAIEEQDKLTDAKIFAYDKFGKWVTATEPLHQDRDTNLGMGPGINFARELRKQDSKLIIGLIPSAVGGTSMSRWIKGGDLYERAVRRTKEAMQNGTLKGILWHQGENETDDEVRAKAYGTTLAQMIADLRADLNAPDVPFIAGQLGEFLYARKDGKFRFAKTVNDEIATVPTKGFLIGVISSQGLGHKGDELHFDAGAQREMGRRYAAELKKLQKSLKNKKK